MSITRGIEVIKKDGTRINDNRYCDWKRWEFDMWISNFLFRKHDLKCKTINDEDGYYVCNFPKEIIHEMGESLFNRQFNICPKGYRFFEGEEYLEDYAERFGKVFMELTNSLKEDEILRYYLIRF